MFLTIVFFNRLCSNMGNPNLDAQILRLKSKKNITKLNKDKKLVLTNGQRLVGNHALIILCYKRIYLLYLVWPSSAILQSMVDLDKILGAPTASHLRCGRAKTVQKS